MELIEEFISECVDNEIEEYAEEEFKKLRSDSNV